MDWRDALMKTLDGQMAVNETMARLLESLTLQADRYDAELDAVRADLRALRARVERLENPPGLHSVRVEP